MNTKKRVNPAALLIGAALILLSLISLLFILLPENGRAALLQTFSRTGI